MSIPYIPDVDRASVAMMDAIDQALLFGQRAADNPDYALASREDMGELESVLRLILNDVTARYMQAGRIKDALQPAYKSNDHVDTKDMSTLMEVVKLLGQIGTVGAGLYVGAGAARETYDALKAKCREMMDKLDEAQSQLENIDPRELDAEMRSAPNLNKTKSLGDIATWLAGAGVIAGVMYAPDIMNWLDRAINAVRDSITYLRFGAELQDLHAVVRELQDAGIQVPAKVQAIVNNPHDGDYGTSVDLNIEYARGWLETTLRMLQDAQERAESMPDEQRSDPRPVDVKSGAHTLYR